MNVQRTLDSGIKIQTEFYKIYKHQLGDNLPTGHKKSEEENRVVEYW